MHLSEWGALPDPADLVKRCSWLSAPTVVANRVP
jgi:hypothetical protein